MLDHSLSHYPDFFRKASIPTEALHEAKRRVLDSLGCFYGAVAAKPASLFRRSLLDGVSGECSLWGTSRRIPADMAAWHNGTCVRALDYNDTYLSLEPCHPSDLIAAIWAACELSDSSHQGLDLLKGMILGYEVVCRLCDARSLRLRGWDHVTYLPIASAVACSFVLRLTPEQTRHAVALAVIGNNAMRQTRVGTISDWKASCAAYAARAGLWASRLAKAGFTGPSDVFAGKHGFFNQVSGPFALAKKPLASPWKILETHVKFFPAEHHAQSAIEAALALRPYVSMGNIREIQIDSFKVAVDIIGSEKEKWLPSTRETADHSMPFLVAAALLDGDVTLHQYENKRFLNPIVRALMKKVKVKEAPRFTRMYPKFMPARVSVKLRKGPLLASEVLRPKGYAGRPMTDDEIHAKFSKLTAGHFSDNQRTRLAEKVFRLEKLKRLRELAGDMRTGMLK